MLNAKWAFLVLTSYVHESDHILCWRTLDDLQLAKLFSYLKSLMHEPIEQCSLILIEQVYHVKKKLQVKSYNL